jgi:hypothetical protein
MDDPVNLPLGVQAVARNAKFVLTRIRSRDGINKRLGNAWVGMDMGSGAPVTGLYSFKYSGNGVVPDKQVPLVYDQLGNLKIESPPGSGVLVPVTSPDILLPANSYLQAAQTQNRAYLAFTNIANPALQASVNAVYDLNTGILDPLSMRPVGEQFKTGETYQVGECVTPILSSAGGNGLAAGRLFRVSAITTGVSGNIEPIWPNVDGASVVSNGITLTENTPIYGNVITSFNAVVANNGNSTSNPSYPSTGIVATASVNAGAGTYAAGRDIYVGLSIVNGNGESQPWYALAISNTTLNDQLKIKITTALRNWVLNLTGTAAVMGFNLYVTDVATGAAAPAFASYGKVAGGPFSPALNTQVLVGVSPAASGTFDNSTSSGVGDVTEDIVPTITPGKIVTLPGSGKFIQGPNGLIPAPGTGTGAPTSYSDLLVNAPGNVDPGPRYAIVLFENRNGYISGYGNGFFVRCDTGISGLQIQMFNIPIGPDNTAKRIICFTQSGGTQAGPFAYIPEDDSVNGIPITSTVIADNVTTTAIFNFTDVYLQDQLATTANVQAFIDKIKLPACRAIIHSPTLDRMIYLTYDQPSGAYITPQRDPETIYASTSPVEVSETDGQSLMGWVHYDGIEYALKEESGHQVLPSADDPANWDTVGKWTGCGPCGLRAYDVGKHFFGFVHRSGIFVSFGAKPEWVSKELGSPDDATMTTWKRINWKAAATIWFQIDDDTHELRAGVPLDGALVPSHVLKCNYVESVELAPAIHSTIYSKGKFISSAAARKWSVDTIAANSCIRATRTIVNAPQGLDAHTQTSQLLYASSFDSSINAVTPGLFTDNGNLIDFVCEGVAPAEALKDSQLGGVQAMLGGSGAITVEVLVGSARAAADGGVNVKQKEIRLKDAYVKPGVITSYTGQQAGRGERFRARFSTSGKPPGTWAEIYNYAIYLRPVFQVQAGGK